MHTLSASSPCVCLGTGVPWVHSQAAGRFLPSQDGWEWGVWGEPDVGAPTIAPAAFQVLHTPIPAPLQCQLPGLLELRAWVQPKTGHGAASWGWNLQLPPTTEVPLVWLPHAAGAAGCSWVQLASLPHVLRPPRGQQCGGGAERGWQGWFSGRWPWWSVL